VPADVRLPGRCHRKDEGRDRHPDRPAGVSTASRRGSAARD